MPLQHTATYCIALQCTAMHCNALQCTAMHCNALQCTATHCNTLQHTATDCNTLQHTATHCNTLEHTATHCNTLQHTATHGESTDWHAAKVGTGTTADDAGYVDDLFICEMTYSYVSSLSCELQRVAVCCSVLQCVDDLFISHEFRSCVTWLIHMWRDSFICHMTYA